MRLFNYFKYIKIIRSQRNNPTVLKIREFESECKKFVLKKWISFYDIETAFQMVLIGDISDTTTEIMIRLKQGIEQYEKKVKTKRTPWKALKIIIDSARKSIVA